MLQQMFMGVDIGTSGVRAALFDTEGNLKSLYHKEYPFICTEPGMGELNPEVVFTSLVKVIKNCIEASSIKAGAIGGIGLSTQMHSFLAIDKNGIPITNVMTWADLRPMKESEYIKENYDCYELYCKTGCRVQHPMYPLSKILWIRAGKPHIFEKAYKFISIKEYVIFRLFGEYVIDFTDASTTGCFNIHRFSWDEDILKDILNVTTDKFGEPVEITCTFKNMNPDYAKEMGIDPKTPVVMGSGDGIAANAGCGVFDDTSMTSTVGTSGALRITVDKPLLDSKGRIWCYCFTKDKWVAGGAINNGGIVLKWLRDENLEDFESQAKKTDARSIYDLFNIYASEVKPGSDGLIFLPYLIGQRFPDWKADATGTVHGLQLFHGKKHLIRASMEGVMFNMFSIYETILQLNDNVKQIKANGGYANSNIWLQIQADIFNKEIAVAGIGEASAFGAAYIAMAAVDAVSHIGQVLPKMEPAEIIRPIAENTDIYKDVYKEFRELYKKIYK